MVELTGSSNLMAADRVAIGIHPVVATTKTAVSLKRGELDTRNSRNLVEEDVGHGRDEVRVAIRDAARAKTRFIPSACPRATLLESNVI